MSKKSIYVASSVVCLSLILTNTSNADLIGWWRLDEGSGLTVNDSSGNEHHGTVQGTPQWGFGPEGFGGALDFSGTTGAYCGVFDPTGGTGTFTLTLWCLWDGSQSIQHFLTKSNGWGADTAMFQIEVKGGHSNPDRVDRLHIAYQAAPQAVLNLVPHNEWVHLALVFDGTHATGYRNGVDDVGPQPTGIGPNVDAPIIIGASHAAEGRTFMGLLDDVRIFDEALPAGQIQAIMQGGGATYPFAYAPNPADGDLLTDIWANLSWRAGDFAVSHDIYIGENFDDVNNGTQSTFIGNQDGTFVVVGFPGFAYPEGLVPGTTYYWRVDEINDTEPNSPWKGEVWSFSIPPKTAYFPNPADGAESVALDARLSWTAGYGSKLHTVYFGEHFDDVNNAAGGLPQGGATYTPGPLQLSKTYYWRVDEFDVIETHKGDVWSFTTEGGVGNPEPANGAVDVKQTPNLTWVPGVYAASHQVYFGADKEAVKNADTSSPEYKGTRDLDSESFEPGQLEWNTTYYWRIDEVNNANVDSPWTGPLWSFTTANFLIIDDMESYNDINEGQAGSNRIYLAWIDGFENPAVNGSVVGNLNPPIAEQTIVHNGNQSMPMAYDNAVGKSEATLTLTSNSDWTVKGVNTLTIWFRGEAANAAENLYVALNDSAVVANDNPDAALKTSWTQWNIDLQAFADQGVNLANVNTITLGLGNKNNPVAGGSGMMYFDDIRLYSPVP
jgi:hypothetical protein